jgi:alpha-L-rhamnosidase
MSSIRSKPTHLRVEHLDDAFGIDVKVPRLSWRLPEDANSQIAYQLRAGDWDSGRINSDQSVLVEYAGPPLISAQRVECSVKVWTDVGESNWSESVTWEMGLINKTDWIAEWIETPEKDNAVISRGRPAWLLRCRFRVAEPVKLARLYATAHGIYEAFLNGNRVGNAELTPGFTSYARNLNYQTFDVSNLLKQGDNVLGVILSDGWYRGQNGAFRQYNQFGDRTAFLAQLHIHTNNGSMQQIVTGPDWTATTGAMVAADLMQGVDIDFRLEQIDWSMPGNTDNSNWLPVRIGNYDKARLSCSPSPAVRKIQTLQPIKINSVGLNRQVIDFGQNFAGWIRLDNLGPKDTNLVLTYGETLTAEGDVTMENIDSNLNAADHGMDTSVAKMPKELGPLQVDHIISSGVAGKVFEPRHSTKGFRYVRVEGYPGQLSASDITGVVVHTDLRRTGWFECSDERINKLHEAAVWCLKGNVIDVPTDCPHRERSGWTSEWQNFVRSAAFLYDVAGFSAKWLRDLAFDQKPDGTFYHCAPEIKFGKSEVVLPAGSAGYSDAGVIVPWRIYRVYGDTRMLADQWASMTAWVERCARVAQTIRHPNRAKIRPVPSHHEAFLIDTGVHFGEYLAPPSGVDQSNPKLEKGRDDGDFATAYFYYVTKLLARVGKVLGKELASGRYRELAKEIQSAWWTEYGNPGGVIIPTTQANYVRALAFGLAPEDQRNSVARNLIDLIRAGGTHVGTGTFGTAYLLPVLADMGYSNLAYELLLQNTPPSWMTMIDRGATTIWEAWDGVDANGRAKLSLNHFSLGSVISFLHTHTAGIRLDSQIPAYRKFRIEPVPGGNLSWAKARLDSPYGLIESSWHLENGRNFRLDVTIPAGTTAEVCLPDKRCLSVDPGKRRFECRLPDLFTYRP